MAKLEIMGKGITSINFDWEKYVLEPMRAGRFIEAYASADAMIDDTAEALLRQIYHDYAAQNLINEIHQLRGRTNFDGTTILLILRNKKVVDEEFYKKVLKFKQKRNLMLHSTEAEYALLSYPIRGSVKTQKELDNLAKLEAEKWLHEAFGIFSKIHDTSIAIHGKEKQFLDYFSGSDLLKK